MTVPLNKMQIAYMHGRASYMPLGSVDMQDVRCFLVKLPKAKIEQAICEVFCSYAALVSRIDETGANFLKGDHRQPINFSLESMYLEDRREIKATAEQLVKSYMSKPFNVQEALWRVSIIEIFSKENTSESQECLVAFSFNGMLVDGFVISRIIHEVFLYAFEGAFNHSLACEREKVMPIELVDEAYWVEYFKELNKVIQLPWTCDIEKIMFTPRNRVSKRLPQDLFSKTNQIAIKKGVFANTVYLLAALKALSVYSSNKQPFAISVPTSGSSINKVCGNDSSFFPVIYREVIGESFVEHAVRLQNEILMSLSKGIGGIEVAHLLGKKLRTILPLPVAFTNGLLWDVHESVKGVEYLSGGTETPQLALDIRLSRLDKDTVLLELDYAEAALSEEVVQLIANNVISFLEEFISADMAAKSDEFTNRESNITFIQDIYDLVFDASSKNIALASQYRTVSYGELGRHIAQATEYLKTHGVKRGDVVAIAVPKSFEHIYYVLACLFSGYIWLPMDKDAPSDRIVFQLRNAKAKLFVCEKSLFDPAIITNKLPSVELIDFMGIYAWEGDRRVELSHVEDNSVAYYLYTSGTTGEPKCVALNNSATNNTISLSIKEWQLTEYDSVFAATPFYHDMSLFDIFGALAVGATLVVPEKEQSKDSFVWASLIEKFGVSIWVSVPAIVDMLLLSAKREQIQSLRLLAQGGDYIREKTLRALRAHNPNVSLYSLGGPTETTIWSIWHKIDIDTDLEKHNSIPYGKALENNEYYILDEQNSECGVGVPGKIAMSGINLANGYVLNGELHFESYEVLNLRGKKHRVHVSRDLGVMTHDGTIIFNGREEGHLKIKGVRISAKEIEHQILKNALVEQCVAVEFFNKELSFAELAVAYTTANGVDIERTTLITELRQILPDSHIPSKWIFVKEIPLTANGKLDRVKVQDLVETDFETHSSASTSASQLKTVENILADSASLLDEETYEKFLNQIQEEPDATVDEAQEETSINLHATEHEQRAWFLHQQDPLSLMSSLTVAFHLKGQINLIKLIAALYALYDRKSSFNSTFFMDHEGVLKRKYCRYQQEAVIDLLRVNNLEEGKERLWELFKQPIDLEKGPIVRFYVISLKNLDECLFGVHAHHILMDNSSWSVVFAALSNHYNNGASLLETDRVRKLFNSEQSLFQKENINYQNDNENYWRNRFSRPLSGFSMPNTLSFSTHSLDRKLQGQLLGSASACSRYVLDISLNNLKAGFRNLNLAQVISEFGHYLFSKSNVDSIDIVTPFVDTQVKYQLDNLQNTSNVLPIRITPDSVVSSSVAAESVRDQIHQGIIHGLPYEQIITLTQSDRNNLPSVLVTEFDNPEKYIALQNVQAHYIDMPPLRSPYTLMLAYSVNLAHEQVRFELTAGENVNSFVTGLLLDEFVQQLCVAQETDQETVYSSKELPSAADINEDILRLILSVYSEALPRSWDVSDNFFDVGGHSLTATLVVGQFKNKYGLEADINDIFSHQTPYELALHLSLKNPNFVVKLVDGKANLEPDISIVEGKHYPVTLLQESYLWGAELGKDTVFNIPFVFKINRDIESDILREAFFYILERHSALRSLIVVSDDGSTLYQRILGIHELRHQDWFKSCRVDNETEAKFITFIASGHGFDLTTEIPLRITHCRLQDTNYLSVLIYHSAFDEWSAKIFVEELLAALTTLSEGKRNLSFTEKPLQYVHYAVAEMNERDSILKDGLSFWEKRLGVLKSEKGLEACFDEESPRNSNSELDDEYKPIKIAFNIKKKDALIDLGVSSKTSLFQVVYGMIVLALYQSGAGEDILVGTSMACRDNPDYHQTIGLFTNVVLNRVRVAPETYLEDFLHELKDNLMSIGKYSKTPFPCILEKLAETPGSASVEYYIQMHASNPLNIKKQLEDSSLVMELLEQPINTNKFGLHFEVYDEPFSERESLVFLIHYDNSKYSENSLTPLALNLKNLLEKVGSNHSGLAIESLLINQEES